MSGMMLVIFGASLFSKQSLVERLARIKQPDLPPQAVEYTRKVTILWCFFFIFNIAIIALAIFNSWWYFWGIYSSFISYILMGILFLGEYLYRIFVIKVS
ncbi:hypothetical protein [Psittacicella hinzii]|nr:hypothetical protein [Psittacicella hinzii]